MPRNIVDDLRLIQLKSQIQLLNLKFPFATLARRMDMDVGNVHRYLNGDLTCTRKFADKFYKAFADDLRNIITTSSGSCIHINGIISTISNKLQQVRNDIQTIEELLPAIIGMAKVTDQSNNK